MTRDRRSLTLDGGRPAVDGNAWFDHQWGDFISVGGGGWDWFAVNLDDGTDLTLSLVRDGGRHATRSSTARSSSADGSTRHLTADDFTRRRHRHLDEPDDGRRVPGRLADPRSGRGPVDRPEPTVADQELDTRATTGVVYWEGSQKVDGDARGQAAARRGVRRAHRVRPGELSPEAVPGPARRLTACRPPAARRPRSGQGRGSRC